MNLQRQLNFWLLCLTMASSSLAFQQPMRSHKSTISPLNMVASVDMPSSSESSNNNEEIVDIKTMLLAQYQAAINHQDSSLSENKKNGDKPDFTSTAAAGAALGLAAHSPLLIGAALGFAGTKLLDGDNAEKTAEAIEEMKRGLEKSFHGTISLAHETIEQEGNLSKLPSKVVQAMFLAKATEDFDGLKKESGKAFEGITAFLSSDQLKQAQEQALAAIKDKDLKEHAMENVKHILESEELKQAPGQAFNAFTSFLNSDQVKQAREQAMKAVKDGLESDEIKALQSKASKALEEVIETKKE